MFVVEQGKQRAGDVSRYCHSRSVYIVVRQYKNVVVIAHVGRSVELAGCFTCWGVGPCVYDSQSVVRKREDELLVFREYVRAL